MGGVNAALSERIKDGALRAPSFCIESRRSLSLYELHNRFHVLRVVASRLSSVVTFACSREEQADHLLVAQKQEEVHVSVVK